VKNKGFTLIEVLIVVVIIAVLASLILPRMTAQSPRAKAAEAFTLTGVIQRTAERQYGLTGGFWFGVYETCSNGASLGSFCGGAASSDWSKLGISGPESSKNWSYKYNGSGSDYQITVQNQQGRIYKYATASVTQWTCDGTFFKKPTPAVNGDSTPCTI